MKIRRAVCIALSLILILSGISTTNCEPTGTVSEAPMVKNPDSPSDTVSEAHEIENPDSLSDTVLSEITSVADGEEPDEGDGIEEVITLTQKSEINNALVSFKAEVPEYFNLGAFVEIQNVEGGEIYRINATRANEYIGRMYIPDGDYQVINCAIDGDIAQQYPLSKPDDFGVEYGSNAVLECRMINFEEVEKEALARVSAKEGETETTEEPDADLFGPISEPVLPWREVSHTGDGYGRVSVSGTSNGVYDFIFEITSTGKPKSGEYKYSSDGGATWTDVAVIPAGSYELVSSATGMKTGLKVTFDISDEFLIYDTYSFSAIHEYQLKEIGTQYGQGKILLTSDGEVENTDYLPDIKITSTGKNGVAEFEYSLNRLDRSDRITIPPDGIYHIPDTVLTITFYDVDGEFVVGDEWAGEIKGITTDKDYTPFVIGAVIVLIIILILIYLFFSSYKDKPEDYSLREGW